ncbi:UNVERIFIED_CONTAM: hypothetical protein Scaly_1885800 [Sesamum calycinum]|uniref:Transcriptional coactivator Hfi1/Transcriptional adapter 1 n=1 Tax=Sesamum calycinum TaxID=2727403 RepID=A0AAW2NFD9_9LAMI
MQPPHQHSRINLAELKAQIVKKLGPEGSKQYFSYLHRFLSLKLSKVEFNKLCLRILGRENIPLHNQFIRSILRNACSAKAPPAPSHKDDALKYVTHVVVRISADGYQQNGSHTSMSQASGSPGLSNGGDMLPVSPRKARTGFRDRRSGDRRSALGPNGKTGFASHLSTTLSVPGLAHMILGGQCSSIKDSCGNQIMREPTPSAPWGSVLSSQHWWARKALPSASRSGFISTFNECALLDSLTLRERMEHIATAQGLEGVSVDCANILNHGLDSYMKGLIRSCIELVGARSGHELTKNNAHKHHSHTKLINGVKQGHQYQIQNGGEHFGLQEQKIRCPISLQDLRVAMELNPRQLGEDWPLLLEKICQLENDSREKQSNIEMLVNTTPDRQPSEIQLREFHLVLQGVESATADSSIAKSPVGWDVLSILIFRFLLVAFRPNMLEIGPIKLLNRGRPAFVRQ